MAEAVSEQVLREEVRPGEVGEPATGVADAQEEGEEKQFHLRNRRRDHPRLEGRVSGKSQE